MRFTDDQLNLAGIRMRAAADSCNVAFWLDERKAPATYRYHIQLMINELKNVATTLGYSFEPLPVTDKPGFDSRDDSSLGMRESDIG